MNRYHVLSIIFAVAAVVSFTSVAISTSNTDNNIERKCLDQKGIVVSSRQYGRLCVRQDAIIEYIK